VRPTLIVLATLFLGAIFFATGGLVVVVAALMWMFRPLEAPTMKQFVHAIFFGWGMP